MPAPDIINAEGFEGGTLGDRLTADNCPGLSGVTVDGCGIFVADPHTGDQSGLLYSGLDGGLSVGTAMTLFPGPGAATEVGHYFKAISGAPSNTIALFNLGHHRFTGLGADKSVRVTANTADAELQVEVFYNGYFEILELEFDTWYEVNANVGGDWYVRTLEGVVASGNFDPMPSNYELFINSGATGNSDASLMGNVLVDDFYYRPAPPAATVAAPTRLYPRSDGLGVGSGRAYPQHRSQQRSNRRAGGYY